MIKFCIDCGIKLSRNPVAKRCRSCANKIKHLDLHGAKNPMFGKHHTKESRLKMSISRKGKQAGEKNPMYGVHRFGSTNPRYGHLKENVGRISLHNWVRRNKPKPIFCEECKEKSPYDLANISGEYKRDINDFRWLCRTCHMKSDGRLTRFKSYSYKKGNIPFAKGKHFIQINGVSTYV